LRQATRYPNVIRITYYLSESRRFSAFGDPVSIGRRWLRRRPAAKAHVRFWQRNERGHAGELFEQQSWDPAAMDGAVV
jgi:hypothetical protein